MSFDREARKFVSDISFYVDDNICNYPEGLRILAIDDNPESLEILSHGLKTCGYQVATMTGMVEAYETLKNNKDSYDLVLTDVKNNMNCLKFADLVTVELDIPLVFMSADDGKETIMNSIKHGAQCYLLKPVGYNELKSLWQHVVRKKYLQLRNLGPKEISTQNSTPQRQMERNDDLEGKKQAKANKKTLQKKQRFSWNQKMKTMFLNAIEQLGIENATPMKILEIMNDPTLTRENVASHLQKYRQNLGKEKEKTKAMRQFYEQTTKSNTLPCSRNQGITDLSYQNRSVQPTHTNSFTTDISQASMPSDTFQFRPPMWANTSKIAASSYQNQNFGTTQEMNEMRFNNVYPRPMKPGNNYSAAYSCFPGGYAHIRAPIISMPPPINSMLIEQPSSFGPIPVQSTQISQPTDSLPMVPPNSSNGQLHRWDSDFTINMIEHITNNPNWPQLYPDQTLLNSEGECHFTFNSSGNDMDSIFNNSSCS